MHRQLVGAVPTPLLLQVVAPLVSARRRMLVLLVLLVLLLQPLLLRLYRRLASATKETSTT